MSFDSCLVSLDLGQRLPVAQLRELSKKYTSVGVSPDTALRLVLNDQLELAKAQEKAITKAVRSAWVAAGRPAGATVDQAPTARPEAIQPGQLPDLNEMFAELLAEEAGAKPASDDLNAMFTELLAEESGVDPRPTVAEVANPKKPRRVRAKNALATLEQEAERLPHLYAIYKAKYLDGKGDGEHNKKVRRAIAAAEKELAFYPPGILTPEAMYNLRVGELGTPAGRLEAAKYITTSLETSARTALRELEQGDWNNDAEAWADFTKKHKHGPHMTREYFDMLGAGVDVEARRAAPAKAGAPETSSDWTKPDPKRYRFTTDVDTALGKPIKKLTTADVYPALTKNPAITVKVADHITLLRPDLKSEVNAVMRDELAYVQRDGKWTPGGKTKLERLEEAEQAKKAAKADEAPLKHIRKYAKKPGEVANDQVRKVLLDAGPMAAEVAAVLGEEPHLVTAVGKAMDEFGYKFVEFDGFRPIFKKPVTQAEEDAAAAAREERGAGEAAVSAVKNLASGTNDVLDALGKLFGGNSTFGSGPVFNDETYAKAKPIFKQALAKYGQAGQDIREVMRTILKAVLDKFGYDTTANMQPYIVRYVEEYRTGKLEGENNNATDRAPGSAARDQEHGPDGHTAAERDIFHVEPAVDGEARAADAESDQAGREQVDRAGVSGRDAATDRAEGNQPVRAPASRPDGRAAEPRDTRGSGANGRSGARPDAGAGGRTADVVTPRPEQGDKLDEQRKAAAVPVKLGDRANIDATLPYLLEGQRDDVAFAERRFEATANGKMPGVLFTNGTGTGKTFTGLGIIARQIRAGKTEGMIVVPNNQIAQDWITSAERLGITIKLLDSTSVNGEKGATITTFANFGANLTLADRDYDWLLADESHYLMASKDGDSTDALATFRALTRHPAGFATYARMKNRALYDQLGTIANKESAQAKALFAQIRKIEEGQQGAYAAIAQAPAKRPRAIFLSATPFAYVKSVDYAEGYLFEYPADGRIGNSNQDGRARFFVQHFGYRIRYHKLTEPDGNVDVGLMARQFNSWLKSEGALSGRMLEVDADYGRRFIQVESALGAKIDEGMEFMREHPEYKQLYQPFMKEFTYLRRRYLLEAIKAKEALPIIQQHLDMGRKVVVIHDYKKGGASNPFHMTGINGTTTVYDDNMKPSTVDLAELAEKFKAERPDLVRLQFPATSALATLRGAFPNALVHNGDIPAKQLEANKALFNDDDSGRNVIILQSDKGREGISLHDTTGKHQRIEVIVGMAAKPTALIQLEGRVYRTGQVTDAGFDYIVTGTMWERWTFAQTIAERADIAEALAMGEQARALKDAIVEAFENAGPHTITADDGKGGKARDRQAAKLLTDWDRARSFYYGQLKRNSSTKALEGKDYFATPEPLGLKMVEWADIRPGEDVLEPSAGHGAIARWFPVLSNKTINEKETELITRARLAVDGQARFLQGNFEDVNIVNKFDAIVMNPPFGLGGSLAIPHLAKAYQHLRDGGRIVALLPRGPAADGKLEKFLYGDKAPKDLYMVADIELPSVTFNRAGTSVPTHVVILDKISDPSKAPHQVARDYTSAEDIEEFFERIQHSTVPGRVKTDQPIEIALEEQKKAPKKQPREAAPGAEGAERFYAQFEFKHTKTGEQLYGAAMLNRTSMDTYKEAASIAKSHGGWYNKFVGGGALRGFLFRSSEERTAFMGEAGQLAEVSAGLAGDEEGDLELRDIDRRNSPRAQADRRKRSIQVDGERRPIYDAEGRLLGRGDFMAQMRFWNWMGDSKAVNDHGEPLTLYHGTNQDFDTFALDKAGSSIDSGFLGTGFYFTDSASLAGTYANVGRGNAQNVVPVYLSLKNPYMWGTKTGGVRSEVYGEKNGIPEELRAAVFERAGFTFKEGAEPDFAQEKALSEALRAELIARGHDGVIATFKNGGAEYVAFYPEQIKSTTGNNGQFDPENPSILANIERRPWERAAQLEWERGTESSMDAALPDGSTLYITEQDPEDGGGVALNLFDENGNEMRAQQIYDSVDEAKAAAQLEYNRIFADSLPDIGALLTDSPLARAEEPKRVATTAKLKKLRRQLEEGKITAEQHAERVGDLINELDERNAAKAAPKPRERGVEWVTERLMRARRLGELDRGAVDFALWALEQAPHLAEDMGISVRAGAGDGTAGRYNPVSRVISLFKGSDNTGTAVHEILHHTERMMPAAIQRAIVKAWGSAWARAYAKADAATRELLSDMLEMASDKKAAERVIKAFGDGRLDYDTHYQLANPSEYWAVNATRLMEARYGAGSWMAKAKRWMSELLEKAKGFLGLQSDAPVLAGLRAVIEGTGERLSPRMLVEEAFATGANRPTSDITRAYTRTQAFRNWFAGSKVIDDDGGPLVMYHGTHGERDIQTFTWDRWPGTINAVGAWFASDADTAAKFAGREGQVMPVYLSIKNPLYVDSFEELLAMWQERAGGNDRLQKGDPEKLRAWLRDQGYDGLSMSGNDMDGFAKGVYVIPLDATQIKSATGNNGEFDPDSPFILRNINRRRQLPTPAWAAPSDTYVDKLRHALQDKHIDMKRTVQAVRDAIGDLGDKWNPYLQEELYHGRSATGFKSFLEHELRPLLVDMQARGVSMEQLEEYLHMRHAEEANDYLASINDGAPDGLAGVKTQDALDYLANLPPAQLAKLQALANRVDAIIKGTQRTLVAYGLEKQESIDAWNGAYQHYVPLMREDMDKGQLGNGTGSGFSIRGPASKARTGSKRAVVDILANVAMQRERAIVRGEKNRIAMALYGMALQAPNPGFWKPVNPQKNKAALDAELVAMGLSPAEARNVVDEPRGKRIGHLGMVESYISLATRNAPHVVAVRINGEDRYIFFNQHNARALRMAAALKNVGEDALDGFMGAVAWATRQLAAMNTQYNPIFGAVNLVRDVGEGTINLSSTPIAGKQADVLAEAGQLFIKVVKGRGRMSNLSGPDAALWAEFQAEGGITGYRSLFARSEDRTKELARELNPDMWMDTKLGKVFTANGTLKVPLSTVRKYVGAPVLDWLSDYNEALENITRLAAYKVAKAEGLSNQQAASLAKNLTVNFNRKGAKTRIIGALYAFFNAAAQGTTRMLETLNGPAGKKIIAGGIILGVLQAAMLAMCGFDDEDIPEFVRAKNLIIPASLFDGEKDYVTIPLPLGFSFLPSIGRIGTEFAIGGLKHPGRYGVRLLSVMLDTFNPLDSSTPLQMVSPTVTDPLAALAENKDFTGRDIAREDYNKLKPTPGHTRAKETASAVGTGLSWFFNAATGGTDYSPGGFSPTPDQIDYFIGQMTGGVGRELMKLQQTVSAKITGEEVSMNKVPLFGRFYSDANDKSALSTKFYENMRQLSEHAAEVNGRRKDGLDTEAYRAEHPEARLAKRAERTLDDIADLRRDRRRALDKGDKVRVKEFELRIRRRMEDFNAVVAKEREAAQ